MTFRVSKPLSNLIFEDIHCLKPEDFVTPRSTPIQTALKAIKGRFFKKVYKLKL
jgi:hypothetical protein